MKDKAKLSVYILAYNEEEKITECVKSATWADEVVVIDSHSVDKTAVTKRITTSSYGYGEIHFVIPCCTQSYEGDYAYLI